MSDHAIVQDYSVVSTRRDDLVVHEEGSLSDDGAIEGVRLLDLVGWQGLELLESLLEELLGLALSGGGVRVCGRGGCAAG